MFLFPHTTWFGTRRPPHIIILERQPPHSASRQWTIRTIVLVPTKPRIISKQNWRDPSTTVTRLHQSFLPLVKRGLLHGDPHLNPAQHKVLPITLEGIHNTHNRYRQHLYSITLLYITYPIQPPPPNWYDTLTLKTPAHLDKVLTQLLQHTMATNTVPCLWHL